MGLKTNLIVLKSSTEQFNEKNIFEKIGFENFVLEKSTKPFSVGRDYNAGIKKSHFPRLYKTSDGTFIIQNLDYFFNDKIKDKIIDFTRNTIGITILFMSVHSVTDFYYFSLYQNGKLLRTRRGSSEGGYEILIGKKLEVEDDLYLFSRAEKGVNYYNSKMTGREWPHYGVGEGICLSVFKHITNIDYHKLETIEESWLYINKEEVEIRLVNCSLKNNSTLYHLLSFRLFLKEKFHQEFLEPLTVKFNTIGFYYDSSQHAFVKKIKEFTFLFKIILLESRRIISTGNSLYIIHEECMEKFNEIYSPAELRLVGSRLLPLKYSIEQQSVIVKRDNLISPKIKNLSYSELEEIYSPIIQQLVIPFTEYFSKVDNIIKHIEDTNLVKAELLLHLKMENEAKRIFAINYSQTLEYAGKYERLVKRSKNLIEQRWKTLGFEDDIMNHYSEPIKVDTTLKIGKKEPDIYI